MNLDSLFADEHILRFTLDNGLTVILKPDSRHAVVSTQYWVKTGSIHEGRFLGSGISHYLEHLMFKGTSTRSGREIQQEVHQLGGYFNAYTSFDRTVYYIDGPAESALSILDILSSMMLDPVFPVVEVEKERNVILREIDMRDDDPDSVLYEKLFATAFREHPYKYPIIGYRDLFVGLQRKDLLEYYQARYVPNNIVLVMVGDFDPVQVEEVVRKHWDKVPRGALPDPVIAEEHPVRSQRVVHDYGDYQISRGVQVFAIPGFSHPDSAALSMLAEIAGAGESSVLWQDLRQKRKLVNQVYAAAWNSGTTGLFYTGFICDPSKRDQVLQALPESLAELRKGKSLKEDQVRQVVRRAVAREIRSRVQVSGQASKLGVAECVAGDIHYNKTMLRRLQEVTLEDIERVAETYLKPEESLTLTLSPKSLQKTSTVSSSKGTYSVQIESGQFANGLRWVVLPDSHLPLSAVGYMALGGSGFDPSGESGVSGLTATLLAKDTQKRTDEQIVREIESVGGSFYGSCGNNTISLVASSLRDDFSLASELLVDGLTQARFDENTFELEKEAQLASIMEEQDDLVSWSLLQLRKRFHGNHPYGIPASGTEEQLSALTRQHVVQQWERLRHPENGVVLLAGDMDWQAELGKLEAVLGKMRGDPAFPLPAMPKFTQPAETGLVKLQRDRQQAIVMSAFPSYGIRDEHECVDAVLAQMLSGMASHLFERVREEQGLAYFVSARRLIAPDWGVLYFFAGTQPESADLVLAEYTSELQRLASGKWDTSEMTGAQTSLQASMRIRQQSLSSRMTDAGIRLLFGLPLLPWDDYDRKVGAVTRGEVQDRAEMLLNTQALSMIVKP